MQNVEMSCQHFTATIKDRGKQTTKNTIHDLPEDSVQPGRLTFPYTRGASASKVSIASFWEKNQVSLGSKERVTLQVDHEIKLNC